VARSILLLWIVVIMAACTPQGKTGTITLESPPDDAIVYSSALTVAGTAQGVNSGGFIVTVTDASGAVIARHNAAERDAAFSFEMIHGYNGEPTPVTLTVSAADAPDDPPYLTRAFTLAGMDHRPEGFYVDILTPQMGDEIGGDEIEVRGRASGLEDRSFTVELVGGDGAVIDSADIVLPPGYVADDLPWQAALDPGDTTGSAIVRVVDSDGTEYALIPVVLSAAAG
jgi:hypothetical protein